MRLPWTWTAESYRPGIPRTTPAYMTSSSGGMVRSRAVRRYVTMSDWMSYSHRMAPILVLRVCPPYNSYLYVICLRYVCMPWMRRILSYIPTHHSLLTRRPRPLYSESRTTTSTPCVDGRWRFLVSASVRLTWRLLRDLNAVSVVRMARRRRSRNSL